MSVHIFKVIAKIMKIIDYVVAINSTSISLQVEICAVHSFDTVGKNKNDRYVCSRLV